MMTMTERSVRENVGGGWGEADRDVMTDYPGISMKDGKVIPRS